MDIKLIWFWLVFILSVTSQAMSVHPFGTVSLTNGLSYCRVSEFHHGGFVYPNSRIGMNKFSEREMSKFEITEALFGCFRFLRYIYPRVCGTSDEYWTRRGFVKMNNLMKFPKSKEHDTRFKGYPFSELCIMLFPFSVTNVVSKEILEMTLIKIYHNDNFLGAVYYNSNIAEADFSFIEVAGNEELVGQESVTPYLSYAEQQVQKELCDDILRGTFQEKECTINHSFSSLECYRNFDTNQVDEVKIDVGL